MGGKVKNGGSDAAEHSPISLGNDYVGVTGSAGWTSIVDGSPEIGSASAGASSKGFKVGAAVVGLAGNASFDFETDIANFSGSLAAFGVKADFSTSLSFKDGLSVSFDSFGLGFGGIIGAYADLPGGGIGFAASGQVGFSTQDGGQFLGAQGTAQGGVGGYDGQIEARLGVDPDNQTISLGSRGRKERRDSRSELEYDDDFYPDGICLTSAPRGQFRSI